MKFFQRFKKKEEPVAPITQPAKKPVKQPAQKKECPYCSLVKTAGRSGTKIAKFVDGTRVKVEIINESNVPERECYSLNIQNNPHSSWSELPITHCPFCGHRLGGK